MFQPSVNRLCGFLEISSLFIALARSGGAQYKAGYLRIQAISNNGGGFGRKSAAWKEKKSSKWCAVRESYLVVLEEPGEVGAMPKTTSRQFYTYPYHSSPYGMYSSLTQISRSNDRSGIIDKV